MRPWLRRQLDPISSGTGLAVVLDPDRLLEPTDLQPWGQVAVATDWYTLRRVYEREGRRREPGGSRLVILVSAEEYAERRDLPYDIDSASTVACLRVPGPPPFREILLDLDDELFERAIRVVGPPRYGNLDDLIADLWGVQLPRERDEARELEAVVQLRSDPTVPPPIWPALETRLTSEMARDLAATPPRTDQAQAAWDDYARMGSLSAHAPTFEQIGPRWLPIFHTGLVKPSLRGAVELPSWTAVGLAEVGPAELLDGLLSANPDLESPGDLAGWAATAEWWGEVRAAMAGLGADPERRRDGAWERWSRLDQAFVPWLRSSYGGLLLSSPAHPLTVDRIAGFLAGRVRRGDANRVLLLVLDGLGLSQWAAVRRRTPLRVVESYVCFAMIPTLTPISRQAIFRGTLPMYYPETIEKTDADGAGWIAFWAEQGLAPKAIRYSLVTGANPEPIPLQDGMTAVGVVIQAIDKMLHGSNVLGDAQLASAVNAWLDRGVLERLVADADAAGFEVWLTSDHGNLETTPLGQAPEGLAVETAGLRVRLYPSAELREGSRLRDGGIAWDPAGLPENWRYPLFPQGRGAYFSGDVKVTHGGISLDEVIVPLVRVAP